MALHPNKSNMDYKGVDLFITLQERDFNKLILFLNNHGGLNAKDEYERTALMECIMEQMNHRDSSIPFENDFAKRLVELGADVNVKEKGGYTALHFAVQANNQEMIDFLLTLPQLELAVLPDVVHIALHFHTRNKALLIKLIHAGNPFRDNDMTLYEQFCDFQSGKVTRGDGPVDMTEVLQALHILYPEKVDHVEPFFLESIQYDYLQAEFRTLLNKKKTDLLLQFVKGMAGSMV